jgi:glutathione S-transferase
MDQYTLYGRPGSGSFAVQVALEELGARYQRIWVADDSAGVALLRSLGPTGKVPALTLPDGIVMVESAAMLIHLAESDPRVVLAPRAGTTAHALFLQWMVFLSANVYEAVLRVYYSARYSPRGEQDAAPIREQGAIDLLAHLAAVSRALGPYVLGERFSIADVYLYMLAGWYPGGKEELYARLPALGELARHVAQRRSILTVEADHAA